MNRVWWISVRGRSDWMTSWVQQEIADHRDLIQLVEQVDDDQHSCERAQVLFNRVKRTYAYDKSIKIISNKDYCLTQILAVNIELLIQIVITKKLRDRIDLTTHWNEFCDKYRDAYITLILNIKMCIKINVCHVIGALARNTHTYVRARGQSTNIKIVHNRLSYKKL